jgi:hypothetical protein
MARLVLAIHVFGNSTFYSSFIPKREVRVIACEGFKKRKQDVDTRIKCGHDALRFRRIYLNRHPRAGYDNPKMQYSRTGLLRRDTPRNDVLSFKSVFLNRHC